MSKRKILALLCAAALLLALAGCGAGQSRNTAVSGSAASGQAADSAAAPDQTDRLPLSGLEREDAAAAARRPVAVMVSNAAGAASHQWGISEASVILEGLTEGKSTNLMLWFESIDAVPKVGPITEGKDLFWQFALAQNSILAQRGSNTYAFNLLNCYAWQPIDALYTGVNCYDYDGSDPAMSAEYNWYTRGTSLQHGLDAYGISADGPVPQWLHFGQAQGGAPAHTLTVHYSAETSTTLTWDGSAYGMFRADGSPQCDASTGVQAAFDNVLVLYCAAGVRDDKFTRDYDLSGGEGLYLTDGTWQAIRWQKGDVGDPLQLLAADGSALTVNPGRTYLGIYGGFTGQDITLTDDAGAAVETGLTAPAPMPTATPAA